MARIALRASPWSLATVALALLALAVVGGARPAAVAAADPPQMESRVLLEGHARLGSWIAIEVRLRNDGPPIVGELRLQGGAQGGTRFAVAVDLPTTSDKTYLLHAQPPSFGQQLDVVLVSDEATLVRQEVPFSIHDRDQLIVGIVAAAPQGIVGGLNLPAAQDQLGTIVVPLDTSDLPERIEAWSALDRLIWQDIDTSSLTTAQLAALRGWLALGGRLVVVGGSTGPGVLSGLPDEILPFRPSTTLDVAPESFAGLLGRLPAGASDVPALAGALIRGRVLASSGDSVIAAEASYGTGSVSIVGIDPTVGWIAETRAAESLWRSMIPPRTSGSVGMSDDNTIINAVSRLPALALPPIGGLLLLLLGYIALIGPINYLVLRRLDRREWALITMPVLIAVFAAGSYGFGSALRGSDVIVNEVAVVRGAPDATEGTAQVYLGVFSPTRGTYQVSVPNGALLSSPINGDIFGGQGLTLDILQGEPSRVRNLSIGFGSLRTIRAETPAVVPRVHAELELVDGVLTGIVRNDSDVVLEQPAVVLGANVAVLDDLEPGATATISLRLRDQPQGLSIPNRVFGEIYLDAGAGSETERRTQTRQQILEQVAYDPSTGSSSQLSAKVPVILAWGRTGVLAVEVQGQQPSRAANVLWYIPASMAIRGETTFRSDLIRSAVVATDAPLFSKDPTTIGFGQGSVTLSYRPVAFQGTFAPSRILIAMGFGGDMIGDGGGLDVEPLPPICAIDGAGSDVDEQRLCPAPMPPDQADGMPDVEVFDRTGDGAWVRLPHLAQSVAHNLPHPERYVDPTTGTFLVRLVNETQNSVSASFQVSLSGTIR